MRKEHLCYCNRQVILHSINFNKKYLIVYLNFGKWIDFKCSKIKVTSVKTWRHINLNLSIILQCIYLSKHQGKVTKERYTELIYFFTKKSQSNKYVTAYWSKWLQEEHNSSRNQQYTKRRPDTLNLLEKKM